MARRRTSDQATRSTWSPEVGAGHTDVVAVYRAEEDSVLVLQGSYKANAGSEKISLLVRLTWLTFGRRERSVVAGAGVVVPVGRQCRGRGRDRRYRQRGDTHRGQCTASGASCPDCGTWSDRVHASYLRFPADLPSAGQRIVLSLRVRRFLCPGQPCPRRTFVEQVPEVTRRHGPLTERLRSAMDVIGLALAGRAGAYADAAASGWACGRSPGTSNSSRSTPQPRWGDTVGGQVRGAHGENAVAAAATWEAARSGGWCGRWCGAAGPVERGGAGGAAGEPGGRVAERRGTLRR